MLTKQLNDGKTVLAKNYKGDAVAVTYANRTQANHRAELLKADGFNAIVIGRRPFYIRVDDAETILKQQFANCHPDFRGWVIDLAAEHNKTWQQVYGWWREYSDACQSGDQSAIWSEFLQWYDAKLKA